MVKLSELLAPRPEPWWPLLKQCGVDYVVGILRGAEQEQRMFSAVGHAPTRGAVAVEPTWTEEAIAHDAAVFARQGMSLIALEDTPPMDKVRLGLAGRDEQIEQVITQVQAMGRLGIPTLCYNWMAISSWGRTASDVPGRGGALVTAYSAEEADRQLPLVEHGEITEEQLWDSLRYFLDAVVPVAEQAGVRLGLHPDDPPREHHRGIPRIMRSPEAYRRLLAIRPSPSNGITFCQGNFALMGEDVPSLIRQFAEQIVFVHLRDVSGNADNFVETFHDEGQTDLVACMRAYAELGFDGPLRPDHVPTMYGEENDRPGYGVLGRIFALGYLRGLSQSAGL